MRKEAVRDQVRERPAEPARVRVTGEQHGHGRGLRVVGGDPSVDPVHQRRAGRRDVAETFSVNSISTPSAASPSTSRSRSSASSSPESGGHPAVDLHLAREGITLILSEASTTVGVSVTPASARAITGSAGSAASTPGPPRPGSSAIEAERLEQRPRRAVGRSPAAAGQPSSTGASFNRALSPARGSDACPATPRGRQPEAEDALLAAANAVAPHAPVFEGLPPPSLSSRSQRTLSGCCSVSQRAPTSPPVSSSATNTSFRAPRAGRQPLRASATAPTASAATCDLHVEGAATPELTVGEVPAPGVVLPLVGGRRTVSTWPR